MSGLISSVTDRIRVITILVLLACYAQPTVASTLETTTRTPPASSCYQGDLGDALDLVARAITLIEEQGTEAAFDRLMDPRGGFIRGDLYVFVLDPEGKVVANGNAPQSVGASALTARDQHGRYFIREILQRAYSVGDGWIRYHWYSPCNGRFIEKQVYFKRSGRYVVCAGFYNTLAI